MNYLRILWASLLHVFSGRPLCKSSIEENLSGSRALDNNELHRVLQLLYEYGHDLRNTAGPWVRIPRVSCPIRFPGWGYVDGLTEGLRINSRLVLTRADDDLGFTKYCILLDRIPALLLDFRGRELSVSYLSEGSLFSPRGFPFGTPKEYKLLPEPVRKILNDVLRHLMNSLTSRHTDSVYTVMQY